MGSRYKVLIIAVVLFLAMFIVAGVGSKESKGQIPGITAEGHDFSKNSFHEIHAVVNVGCTVCHAEDVDVEHFGVNDEGAMDYTLPTGELRKVDRSVCLSCHGDLYR